MVCSAAEQTVGVKVSCVKKGWRVVQDSLCVEQRSMWVSCELFDCLSLRRCSTDWLVCSISHEKNDCSHLKHWKRVVYSLHVWKYVVSIAEYIARICGFQHTSYIFIYFLINQHIYVFLWHPHDFMVYHPSFKLVSFELQTQDPSLMVETCFMLPGLKVPPIGLVVVNSSHEEPGCFFVKEVETWPIWGEK